MDAAGTLGILPRNSTTGGAALPDHLGGLRGSGQCVDRRVARRELAHRAAVAQAGPRAGIASLLIGESGIMPRQEVILVSR